MGIILHNAAQDRRYRERDLYLLNKDAGIERDKNKQGIGGANRKGQVQARQYREGLEQGFTGIGYRQGG